MNWDYLLFTLFSLGTLAGWTAVAAIGVWFEMRLRREQREETERRLRELWKDVNRDVEQKRQLPLL